MGASFRGIWRQSDCRTSSSKGAKVDRSPGGGPCAGAGRRIGVTVTARHLLIAVGNRQRFIRNKLWFSPNKNLGLFAINSVVLPIAHAFRHEQFSCAARRI